MQPLVKLESPTSISRKLQVTLPVSFVKSRYEKRLQDAQKTAKLKGFRPGHVPMEMVKKIYSGDIEHSLYHALVEEGLHFAITENKLRAVGHPEIDHDHDHSKHKVNLNQDFSFSATVQVVPEIEVKNYKGIALKKEPTEITDEMVQKTVSDVLSRYATYEVAPVGHKSSAGDLVHFKFNGQVFKDSGIESTPAMKGDRSYELGTNELLPEFETSLTGLKVNESKAFRINYPKDYPEKDLAGNEAEFTVELTSIQLKKMPELNDEFAKKLNYESVADFTKKAKESLVRSITDQVDEKLKNDLIQALIEKNPFEIPQALIHEQANAVARDYAQRLEREGFTQKMIQESIQSQAQALTQRGEGMVRAGLLLSAIAKKENIVVSNEDMNSEIKRLALGTGQDEKTVIDLLEKSPERRENIQFRLLEEKTVQFLLSQAKIK